MGWLPWPPVQAWRDLPNFVGVHPLVWRDLLRRCELDHVHRRGVTPLSAGPAFQRGLKLPDRRVPRPADGIERQACPRLAAVALDLQPAQAAVEALRRRLRWSAVAFHLDGPRFRRSGRAESTEETIKR